MSRNILVLSSLYHYTNMTQMLQYLAAYPTYSRHKYFFHNFVYAFDPDRVDLSAYDVIMFPHNFWPMNFSDEQFEAIANADALKVVFLQDEYQEIHKINEALDRLNTDLVFSCVNEEHFDVFYSPRRIKSLKAVYPVLTGYIDDSYRRPGLFELDEKTYDVGFRSRVSPYHLGTLGHEKYRITQEFGKPAEAAGLRTNISVSETDRLAGDQWTGFLQTCRTQLGTPSGSSVIDFDGRIIRETASYRRAFPDAEFETVRDDVFGRYDGRYAIDTVSPRVFECAAAGSTLVQLAGKYGGYLEPGVHYIEIAKDYSNVADVIEQIRDDGLVRKIAKRAHKDLIETDRFHFRGHIARFDDFIDEHTKGRSAATPPSEGEFYQVQAAVHDQSFKLGSQGVEWLNTLSAKTLRDKARQDEELRAKPMIGKMIKRMGGIPHVKKNKGEAALELVKQFSAYRNVLMLSALFPSIKPENMLREILLLGVIQAGHEGMHPGGTPFYTRLAVEPSGRLRLQAVRPKWKISDADFPQASKDDIKDGLRSGAGVVLDVAPIHPLQTYAGTLVWPWRVQNRFVYFRSEPDLLFHLDGLSKMGRLTPGFVSKAIKQPMSKTNVDENRALFERIFLNETL